MILPGFISLCCKWKSTDDELLPDNECGKSSVDLMEIQNLCDPFGH